jgi:hypothetical protein
VSATATLLADLGVEVITAPTEQPGVFVVALILADLYDDETSAELAANDVQARLAEAIEADLSAPLRVPSERLELPT